MIVFAGVVGAALLTKDRMDSASDRLEMGACAPFLAPTIGEDVGLKFVEGHKPYMENFLPSDSHVRLAIYEIPGGSGVEPTAFVLGNIAVEESTIKSTTRPITREGFGRHPDPYGRGLLDTDVAAGPIDFLKLQKPAATNTTTMPTTREGVELGR